jgi:hypothetical protein
VSDQFEVFGESFRFADPSDYEFAMMEFADAAEYADVDTLAGAATIMRVLKAVVHPDDVKRFTLAARTNRARVERDLLPIVVEAFGRETGRPTGQPAESSDGLQPMSETSVDDSSLRVIHRLEDQGRPDLALMVDAAQRSRASA